MPSSATALVSLLSATHLLPSLSLNLSATERARHGGVVRRRAATSLYLLSLSGIACRWRRGVLSWRAALFTCYTQPAGRRQATSATAWWWAWRRAYLKLYLSDLDLLTPLLGTVGSVLVGCGRTGLVGIGMGTSEPHPQRVGNTHMGGHNRLARQMHVETHHLTSFSAPPHNSRGDAATALAAICAHSEACLTRVKRCLNNAGR